MRRFLGFIIVMTLIITGLMACSQAKDREHYDLAILEQGQIFTFRETEKGLEQVERVKRPHAREFWPESIESSDKSFIGRTREGNQGLDIFMLSFDKETLAEKMKPAKGNNVYTGIYDGEYYYAAVVFTDRIEFYKYNHELEVVHQKVIPNKETINCSNQFVWMGNQLYLLVSEVVTDTQEEKTEIWQMDEAFNLLKRFDLDERGACLRMATDGKQLYVTKIFEGKDENGLPISGNKLISFNVESGEKEVLEIPEKYPNRIFWNPQSQKLFIENDFDHNQGNYSWTLVNPQTGEVQLIEVDSPNSDMIPPFFTRSEKHYYLLYQDHLKVFSFAGEELKDISLKKFGIKEASALLLK